MESVRMILFLTLIFLFVSTLNSEPEPRRRNFVTLKEEMEKPSQFPTREKRLFPIFQIVRFENEACAGTGNLNGTCYTSRECNAKGGSSIGSCAHGYGVCCTFSRTCGQMSNENCTYFTTPDTIDTTEDCTLEICPCGDNICQIRLDFVSFMITGPSTSTTQVGQTLGGRLVAAGGAAVSDAGQCRTDAFSVISPGNTNPPVLCGNLQGEHLYVDLNEDTCNELRFNFGNMGLGAGIAANRMFDIKITQYSCDYDNLAPPGCTQYFFGENQLTGMVRTFNFPGRHLADQNQRICVRQERGQCRICWAPTSTINAAGQDFAVSGLNTQLGSSNPINCCGFGAGMIGTIGFDCLEVPGVRTGIRQVGGAVMNVLNSRFCGRSLGIAAINAQTVCSQQTPFSAIFRSDRFEFAAANGEAFQNDPGFMLAYTMDAVNCNN